MASKYFTELPEHHIGAFSRSTPIFGLIISVAETENETSADTVVQFKPEGSNEILERRIAAFEQANQIIKDIACQIEFSAEKNFICKPAAPAPDNRPVVTLEEELATPTRKCRREHQVRLARIRRAQEKRRGMYV